MVGELMIRVLAFLLILITTAYAGFPSSGRKYPQGNSLNLNLVDHTTDTSSQTIYTTGTLNFGTASADRCLVVGFGSRANAARTISSVTIGGIAATAIATANDATSGADISAIYAAPVPTGTSGTVVVTYSAAMLRFGLGIWRISGSSTCATSSYNATSTTVVSNVTTINLNINPGGGGIANYWQNTSGSPAVSWAGLTEDYDDNTGGNGNSGSGKTFTISQSSLSITATGTATVSRGPLAGASWSP